MSYVLALYVAPRNHALGLVMATPSPSPVVAIIVFGI